jgi:hypothetical protein
LIEIQLPEKYKENFDVSSEGRKAFATKSLRDKEPSRQRAFATKSLRDKEPSLETSKLFSANPKLSCIFITSARPIIN